jgi:hypothetical protein
MKMATVRSGDDLVDAVVFPGWLHRDGAMQHDALNKKVQQYLRTIFDTGASNSKMKQSAATCVAALEVMAERGEILHSEVPLVSRISALFSKWSKQQKKTISTVAAAAVAADEGRYNIYAMTSCNRR